MHLHKMVLTLLAGVFLSWHGCGVGRPNFYDVMALMGAIGCVL
jgi:hypothetical protein